jgi:Fe-S cluster assembly ATP-binding protein
MLQIKNLKIKSIDSPEKVLIENANLNVDRGELIQIDGINGSGKSTLLSSIMNNSQFVIAEGEILVDGIVINNMQTFEIARLGVYYMMQHTPEIEGVSTIKMLYKAKQILDSNFKDSITTFKKNLDELADKFNLDKSLLLRDVNVGFSGGQKRQVELLHILALNPKYLLLDEPDSGVDKTAIETVYKVINYLRENGAGIILVSHNLKASELNVNRIYNLNDGKLILK